MDDVGIEKIMIDGGLRKIFQQKLPFVHWQSIETGLTGRGVPDLNGCYRGKEIWIECKRTKHWRVSIAPEQVGWIERRIRNEGNVFIATRRAKTELWLMPGGAARELANGARLDQINTTLGSWNGGPAGWPWDDLIKLLFSHKNNMMKKK